jgi:hypothetical protein
VELFFWILIYIVVGRYLSLYYDKHQNTQVYWTDAELDQQIQSKSDKPSYYLQRGSRRMKLGAYAAALEDLNQAIELYKTELTEISEYRKHNRYSFEPNTTPGLTNGLN